MNASTSASTTTLHENPSHVIVRGDASGFLQGVVAGSHGFQVDEPRNLGGSDKGPDPYDLLLAALGACTSMTISFYARRKKIPLKNVTVALQHSRIHAQDCEECETKDGMLDRMELSIELAGSLSKEERASLMEIARKCPVYRTLTSEIDIRHREVS